MTVGELIHQQAKNGYVPTASLSSGFISTLQRTTEESQKLIETLRKPMENMQRIMESVRPLQEAMSRIQMVPKIAPPFIPSLYEGADEDLIMTALDRSVQEYTLDDATITTETKYVKASYQLPGNASWESLEMHFIDGHVVRVSYPGKETKRFDFKDMGFVNERTMRPDMKWEMLRTIADRGGALTKEHWDFRLHRNIKYELNEGLKQFFGMTKNPIPRYTRRHGYTTLFVIRGDR
jgi:hypothetical protein